MEIDERIGGATTLVVTGRILVATNRLERACGGRLPQAKDKPPDLSGRGRVSEEHVKYGRDAEKAEGHINVDPDDRESRFPMLAHGGLLGPSRDETVGVSPLAQRRNGSAAVHRHDRPAIGYCRQPLAGPTCPRMFGQVGAQRS